MIGNCLECKLQLRLPCHGAGESVRHPTLIPGFQIKPQYCNFSRQTSSKSPLSSADCFFLHHLLCICSLKRASKFCGASDLTQVPELPKLP